MSVGGLDRLTALFADCLSGYGESSAMRRDRIARSVSRQVGLVTATELSLYLVMVQHPTANSYRHLHPAHVRPHLCLWRSLLLPLLSESQ